MPTEKYLLGSQSTILTTGADAANNDLAIGSAFDNTAGATGDGYTLCDIVFEGSYAIAPSANSAVTVWLLMTSDGTTYEDGDGTVGGSSNTSPARLPEVVLPLRAVTGTQRITQRIILPWGKFKPLLKNDNTAQTLSSGATLKIRPVTRQSV